MKKSLSNRSLGRSGSTDTLEGANRKQMAADIRHDALQKIIREKDKEVVQYINTIAGLKK